jgi:hypothetical protein
MTRTLAWLAALLLVLLVAWASRAGRPPAQLGGGPPPSSSAALASELGATAVASSRLRAHAVSPPAFVQPRRNLFHFRQPVSTSSAAHAGLAAQGAAPADAPARPDMTLIGIAEDGAASPARTAIVSVGGEVYFARERERILDRYEVVRITPDAAQLRDSDGRTFTLALR